MLILIILLLWSIDPLYLNSEIRIILSAISRQFFFHILILKLIINTQNIKMHRFS